MNTIIISVLVLGIMGLIFGVVLAFASQKFAVETDERVDAILEVLPGANCGGCGFPGCGGLATAVVEGKAPVNGIIKEKPVSKEVVVECNSKEFGKDVKEKCIVGCIGCGMCVKACKYDAIIFEDKLARIDYDKCVGCMECVRKCPTKVIKGNLSKNA